MFKNRRNNMKIKRLIAGGLTAAVAGATIIGGALAATTFDQGLGQFVSVSGGALTSPVIVVGANVDTTDVLGATDIAASLVSNYAVTQVTIPGGGASANVVNGVLIKSDLNKTYLSAGLSTVKTVLTNTDLPDLLAQGTFTDMNSTTSTITEKIVLNSAASATFGIPSGATDPVLYLPVTMTTTPYNLTVTFIGGLDPTAVDTTYGMRLFGKDYTFGNTHTNTTLEIFSSAGAQVVDLSGAGAEKTASVGAQSFDIKLNGWDTAGTKAYVSVNGVSYTWNEGSTYTVSGVKFYVQSVDVIYTGAQEASGLVKIFVGTDKLRLVNGQAIEKNDVTKNSLVFISSTTSNKINSITFQVYPDDDVYVQENVAFTDPVFGSFKTVLSGMTPGLTDSSRDLIKVNADSSNVKLSFKNKDGMQYNNIPVFYGNSSSEVIYGKVNNAYYFHVRECNTNTTGSQTIAANTNISKGDYFAVSSGDYSYLLKYSSYNYDNSDSSKTYVTFTDLATNTNYKVYPASEDLTVGSSTFDVIIWGDKTACVSLDGGSTYSGAYVNITTGALARIDLQSPSTGMYIDEVPLYTLTGANDPARTKFLVNSTYSSSSGIKFTMVPNPTQVGTNNEWKYISTYGSYVDATGDTNGKNAINLYNAGQRPAYANIAMGTNPVISTSAGAAGGTYNAAVPVTNPIAKFPSEVTQTASLGSDLVLVGGPCANDLVRGLLNTAWNSTNSCDTFSADTTINSNGKGLIQVVENVFGSGHKALIVAGWSAADTRALVANKVIKPTVFTGLGAVSQYKGTVA
jgi:hypothetical protein